VQREKTTALLMTELEEQQRDMPLMGMCKRDLPCEALEKLQRTRFNLNALGDSESVDTLHPKRQSVLGNVQRCSEPTSRVCSHRRPPQRPTWGAECSHPRRDSTKSFVGAAIATGVAGGEKKQSRSGSSSARVFGGEGSSGCEQAVSADAQTCSSGVGGADEAVRAGAEADNQEEMEGGG
jgi:hypothetical protein